MLSVAVERLDGASAEALRRAGSASMTSRDVAVLQDAMLTAGVRNEVEKLIIRHVEDAHGSDGWRVAPGRRCRAN